MRYALLYALCPPLVSKILKPLEHAGKKQEVLAISSNIKKQKNLLSIVQLEERERNAKNETQRILQVLDELGISRIFSICPGFDFTSVGTAGLRNYLVAIISMNYSARLRQNWFMEIQKVHNWKHSLLLLQHGPD